MKNKEKEKEKEQEQEQEQEQAQEQEQEQEQAQEQEQEQGQEQEQEQEHEQNKNIYNSILGGYDDLDFASESIKEEKETKEEIKKETRTAKKDVDKVPLSSLVSADMAIQGLNSVMSVLSPLIFNRFSEHKTSREDWLLNQNDMNVLFLPTKLLLEQIKLRPSNPYLMALGSIMFVYGSKSMEILNAKKHGVKMSKNADKPSVKTSKSSAYVKKWLDRKKGILNPEWEKLND